jgi:hypothetical protein
MANNFEEGQGSQRAVVPVMMMYHIENAIPLLNSNLLECPRDL